MKSDKKNSKWDLKLSKFAKHASPRHRKNGVFQQGLSIVL